MLSQGGAPERDESLLLLWACVEERPYEATKRRWQPPNQVRALTGSQSPQEAAESVGAREAGQPTRTAAATHASPLPGSSAAASNLPHVLSGLWQVKWSPSFSKIFQRSVCCVPVSGRD